MKVWTATGMLSIIWKSDFFLHGCTYWALTKHMEKTFDGNYTRMLPAVLNKS